MTLVDEILDDAGFSKSAIDAVKAGKLHYGGSLDAASDKELSVKLAFHLKAELQGAKEIFLASPKKKEYDPTVQSLGMIAEDGGDGSLDDFSGIILSNEKVMEQLYRSAASDLNLAKDEIEMFKKCTTHEEVEHCLRQILLDRFRAYKENGLAGIKPYARWTKEFSTAEELKNQIKAGRTPPTRSTLFNEYVVEYPKNPPAGAEESFFWVNSIIDNKPTIALVHRVGMPHDGGYVYMERHFYLSRSHNCLQGFGAALPVEDGAVILYLTRTSTDQVGGLGSTVKRAIGNKMMGARMADNFERARAVLAAAVAAKEMDKLTL